MRCAALLALVLFLLVPTQDARAVSKRDVAISTRTGITLKGSFYVPDRATPVPGILILHHAGGLREPEHNYARRLASSGFAALAVAYPVGWIPPPNMALAEAVDWIAAQPESSDMPVGVLGFSIGGSKALLVAALRPQRVKAVVAYYATYNVRISKFAPHLKTLKLPAPSPVDTAARIGGAILLLNGADDDETDPKQTAQMQDLLTRSGKTFRLKAYPGAVHMFDREPRAQPPNNRTNFGTVTGYNETAARDAWQQSLSWFNQYLRQGT